MLHRIAFTCLALVMSMHPGFALGEEKEGQGEILLAQEEHFIFGDSCRILSRISMAELQNVTQGHHEESFNAFCKPEEGTECLDYDHYVEEYGFLIGSSDAKSCDFIPLGER